MKTPKEKYDNDPAYHKAVDTLEALIHQGQFTPSEMREIAVLASIHYEMRHSYKFYTVPTSVNAALCQLEGWRNQEQREFNAKAKAPNIPDRP